MPVLGYGLVDADGQHKLVGIVTHLHLVEQPGFGRERRSLQLVGRQVVDGNGESFVFVVAIEVVVAQVGLLLGSHHALHQFHGGVVLAAIAVAAGLDGDALQLLSVGLQRDVQMAAGATVDGDDARFVAQGTHRDVPSLVAVDGVFAPDVGHSRDVVTLINDAGKGNRIARLIINHSATNLWLLCVGGDTCNQRDDKKGDSLSHKRESLSILRRI